MTLPNPACTVNSSSPPVSVTAGATCTIALANTSGANYWSIVAVNTDETNTAAAINATLSVNQTNKTATFTAPASLGAGVIFQSKVGIRGLGLDSNGFQNPALTTTFKVYVPTSTGGIVLVANEQQEQIAGFGWLPEINALIRNPSVGGGVPTIKRDVIVVDPSGNSTVQGFQTVPISAATPTAGQGYFFDAGTSTFKLGTSITVPKYFTDLASYTPISSRQAILLDGYATTGDGGGGRFNWVSTSTATPDSGTIVQVTGISTGRWVRDFEGPLKPQWFGAPYTSTSSDAYPSFVLCDTAASAQGRSVWIDNDFTLHTSWTPTCKHIIWGASAYAGIANGFGDANLSSNITGAVLRFTGNTHGITLPTGANGPQLVLENPTIVGPAQYQTTGLYQSPATNCRLYIVGKATIANFYCALDLGSMEVAHIDSLYVAGCVYGVRALSTSNSTTNRFDHAEFIRCAYPISLYGGQQQFFKKLLLEACSAPVVVGGTQNENTFEKIYQENTGSAQFNSSHYRSLTAIIGQTVCPHTYNGRVYMVTTVGTTGAGEPTGWGSATTLGQTVTDSGGTVVYTDIGPGGSSDGTTGLCSSTASAFRVDTTAGNVASFSVLFHHLGTETGNYFDIVGTNEVHNVHLERCTIPQVTIPSNWSGEATDCLIGSATGITNNSAAFRFSSVPNGAANALEGGQQAESRTDIYPRISAGSGRVFLGTLGGAQFGGPFPYPFAGYGGGQLTSVVMVNVGDRTIVPAPAPGAPTSYRCTTAGQTAVPWRWASGGSVPLGFYVLDQNNHIQKCTTAGASNAYSATALNGGAPNFSTSGGTVTDGSVVWTDQGAGAVWTPEGIVGPDSGDPTTYGTPRQLATATVSVATNNTPFPAQVAAGKLVLTGTVPSGGTTLDLGSLAREVVLSYSGVTFSGTLTLKSGVGTLALVPNIGKRTSVSTDGAGGIAFDGASSGAGGSQSSVALVNGANHNVAVSSGTFVTVGGTLPTAAVTIGGFTPTSAPFGGQKIAFCFNVNQQVTFTYNSGSDTYPLLNKTGADLVIVSSGVANAPIVEWVFDSNATAWRLV